MVSFLEEMMAKMGSKGKKNLYRWRIGGRRSLEEGVPDKEYSLCEGPKGRAHCVRGAGGNPEALLQYNHGVIRTGFAF